MPERQCSTTVSFIHLLKCPAISYTKCLIADYEQIAQVVKCLLYKHEDLSWDLQDPSKKLGVAVCTCNPSLREAEIGELPGASWLASLAELGLGSVFKK